MRPEDFGLTKEQASKAKDIVPSFDLGGMKYGEVAKFRILENETKEVEFKDDKNKTVKRRTIKVLCLDDNRIVTLWLSSTSLQMEFWKLSERHKGEIKNLEVNISPRMYIHKEYGKTKAYTVTETI